MFLQALNNNQIKLKCRDLALVLRENDIDCYLMVLF